MPNLTFLLFLALSPVLIHAVSPSDYGKVFHGDGTYYGYTTDGNCAIRAPFPSMYNGMVPVAINNDQYDGSLACGACVVFEGTGPGAGANPIRGPFLGVVTDRCPECKHGDLDLAQPGDGRWDIKWHFVPCPGQKVAFFFEGSNTYYYKIQPRGVPMPIKKLFVSGREGRRVMDNFFEIHNGAGFETPTMIKLVDINDHEMNIELPRMAPDGAVLTNYNTGGSRPTRRPPTRRPTTRRPPTRRPTARRPHGRCTPRWKACTGRNNWWRSSDCCSSQFHCVTASDRSFVGKRCERKRSSCVPHWKACTGRNNTYGTSRCCGSYKCVRPRKRGFAGKRCVPRRRSR